MLFAIAPRSLAVCLALTAIACGGEERPEVDGGSCGAIAECGGDLVGRWTVESLCFDSLDEVFASLFGDSTCAGAVEQTHVAIAGIYDFDRDGGLLIDVTQSIDFDTAWSADCLGEAPDTALCAEIEEGLGSADDFASAACELENNTCVCSISTIENRSFHGELYEVRGALLRQSGAESSFCVQGDELRIRRTAAGATGTLVLKRE